MTQIKPIIFSAPMVRALLDGRKTQTRRVLKPDDRPDGLGPNGKVCHYYGDDRLGACLAGSTYVQRIPYAPGDLLWVRENWSGHHVFRHTPPSQRSAFAGEGMPYLCDEIWYWADGSPEYGDWEKPRPSIHMPRWASRLTLRVTDVRVQRVREISADDARAEGIEPTGGRLSLWADYDGSPGSWADDAGKGWADPVDSFRSLWDSINAKRGFGWDANPWVAAYTFDVIRKNVDEVAG